jgi:nucleotide-binding universal stress UspA family protein
MKNILVPIGSNTNAINTLQYAIDFVEGTTAKIYIINVYGVAKAASSMKNIDAILEKDSTKELKKVLHSVDKKGVEIISKAIKGSITDSIVRVAKQLDVTLIISSAKSNSTDETVFLGKITGSLIKQTNLPVLVVPKEYKFKPIAKVLMAIKSGTISAKNVLTPLEKILNKYNASLDLLRVVTPKSSKEDADLNSELDLLVSNFTTSENGTIFQGVLEHLHDANPDLLCVIRRKRGFFKRLWEKDKVYKKDFQSKVPLLILKGSF